ncbi:MAG: heparan-alpha-glucosaminide N-acetyltransferase [Methanobacteriaceae archaeon]
MDLKKRFWEIDVLRGLAIVMMIIFHFLFDLNYFGVYPLDISSGFLWLFARTTASIFLFLVGVSLSLSHSRALLTGAYQIEGSMFFKYLKRGLKIFLLGLLITLATWLFIPQEFIVFGVLHFIGIAIILEYPFLNRRYLNLLLGVIFLGTGIFLAQYTFSFTWFLWLGLQPTGFITIDYFPLLPWLGVVSLGLFTGGILYKNYQRRFSIPDLSSHISMRFLSFLGRYSLIIYLIHQPVLILVLYLMGIHDLGNLSHLMN